MDLKFWDTDFAGRQGLPPSHSSQSFDVHFAFRLAHHGPVKRAQVVHSRSPFFLLSCDPTSISFLVRRTMPRMGPFGNDVASRSLTPAPTPNPQQRRAWGPGFRELVCPFTPTPGVNGARKRSLADGVRDDESLATIIFQTEPPPRIPALAASITR